MIEMTEKLIGMWYVQLTPTSDYMAGLSWESEESIKTGQGNAKLTYRFRYYDEKNGDPFTGNDKKNWYAGTIAVTDKKDTLKKVQEVISIIAVAKQTTVDEILNTGGVEQLIHELKTKHWAHIQEVPISDPN